MAVPLLRDGKVSYYLSPARVGPAEGLHGKRSRQLRSRERGDSEWGAAERFKLLFFR